MRWLGHPTRSLVKSFSVNLQICITNLPRFSIWFRDWLYSRWFGDLLNMRWLGHPPRFLVKLFWVNLQISITNPPRFSIWFGDLLYSIWFWDLLNMRWLGHPTRSLVRLCVPCLDHSNSSIDIDETHR